MPSPGTDLKLPESKRGLWVPLLVNAVLVPLLGALVYPVASPDTVAGAPHPRDVGYGMFLLMLGLAGVDVVALFIAALLRRPRWVNGFALASLLVFLIRLGSCGYMFTSF
ncbi:hypothetical protein [Hymenobacter coccineus]|uniref:Uncharacterized protein n=1 Tax=Hymenobacter coccineus TaxID=1908235 RepID=A0A1G1TI90_9BACT|nr:hypothetical protein [Hymenobacter coccineus]OGX90558.1 hypothetical protein BEN49_06545 [Hymenobacter coccineus]